MTRARAWLGLVAAGVLSACGGGTKVDVTYTVGGSVTGLTGTGLSLQNNGGNTLQIASNGPFSFSTTLSQGDAYLVTVQTQPSGQTCSVANGSGPITGNVGNVLVTCVAYTISGTITGLNSAGLVLRNNGENLSVTSGSTSFVFPTALPTGATYAVTVQTQPAGKTCSVTSGTGTVGTSNVTNVVVSCVAYTIGGSITGLNSAGLVLQNNGESLPVTLGSTSFVFPTALPTGATYAVTVQTQPAGKTCTVTSGGTGTVASANVSNVVVTCTAYTISGSISGLSSAGLVLSNNGESLPVAAGSTSFVFPTALPSGTTYAVTVQTQPAGKTCSVAFGSGTVVASNVTGVMVSCVAYTIGGSITGLTSAGLVLSNNGENLSVASGNTAFTFLNAVPSGTAYAVTVQTQPAGKTCTVTSGTGTVGSANVTNVVVACVAYTIGGSISGLSGTGLVLLNNGANALSVASGTTFTFTTAVPSGTAYAVTVQTQPGGQNCVVTSGTGTVASANVTSVVVTCTTYLTLTSANPTNGATNVVRSVTPSLTFSATLNAGTVTTGSVTLQSAAGSQAVGLGVTGSTVNITPTQKLLPVTNYTVTATTAVRGSGGQPLASAVTSTFRTKDGVWLGRELVETDSGGSASLSQIVMDANGNAIAVWHYDDGARNSIWANRYRVNVGWGTAAPIETNNAEDASYPLVAMDASGNATAVWNQYDGTRFNMWANRYTANVGWGTAQLIEADAGDANSYSGKIVMDANGNATAVWQQHDGALYSYMANRYTAGAGWGTASLIETDNAGDAYDLQIGVDPGGNVIAVWDQFDGNRTNIWSNRYTANVGWGTAQVIEANHAGDAYSPQIAVDAGGSAVAVWYQSDGTRYNIWSNRYTVNVGWGAAELIETDNTGSMFSAQIAMDPSGNAIAVWYRSSSVVPDVWSNRYTVNVGWSTAQLIETSNTGSAFTPQIVMDPNGNAIATWGQFDGTRTNIWSNRYAANVGWGTAVLIETDNAGSAESPRIVVDASGNAIAVWEQFDGVRSNIWSNRYTANVGWGTAVLIEIDNAGSAVYPLVVMDARGDALAVWGQYDSVRINIHGERFE